MTRTQLIPGAKRPKAWRQSSVAASAAFLVSVLLSPWLGLGVAAAMRNVAAPSYSYGDATSQPGAALMGSSAGSRIRVDAGVLSPERPNDGRRGSSRAASSRTATEAGTGGAGALERQWAQAPNNGYFGGWSKTETIQPGTVIDRYEAETGRFLSPAGTSFEARALPAGSGPLQGYEVLKPFDVQAGIVGPAFGQPGGGIQYMSPQTVADLIEGGFIKSVG